MSIVFFSFSSSLTSRRLYSHRNPACLFVVLPEQIRKTENRKILSPGGKIGQPVKAGRPIFYWSVFRFTRPSGLMPPGAAAPRIFACVFCFTPLTPSSASEKSSPERVHNLRTKPQPRRSIRISIESKRRNRTGQNSGGPPGSRRHAKIIRQISPTSGMENRTVYPKYAQAPSGRIFFFRQTGNLLSFFRRHIFSSFFFCIYSTQSDEKSQYLPQKSKKFQPCPFVLLFARTNPESERQEKAKSQKKADKRKNPETKSARKRQKRKKMQNTRPGKAEQRNKKKQRPPQRRPLFFVPQDFD